MSEINPSEILSESELIRLVHNIWQSDMEIVDFKITPYSPDKLGYLATHCSIHLTARDNKTEKIKTQKLFLKNKPLNSMVNAVEDMRVFEKETTFYSKVVPLLKDGFVSEKWGPRCYMVTDRSLIFEELREKGFAMRNKLLTKEEMTAALTTLASLHAASITAENKLGRPLNEVYPVAFETDYFFKEGFFQNWVNAGINLGVALANKLGLDGEKLRTICGFLVKGLVPSKTKRNVICHADPWSNNIMFSDESPPKAVMVDYQMTRYGPLIQDVLFLMYLCSMREFRNMYEKELTRHYYAVLCEILKNNKQSVPAWSELSCGTEEVKLSMAIMALLYHPTTALDNEICTNVFKDSEFMVKFIFEDRVNMVTTIMEKDKVYAERIEQAVQEVYELGSAIE